MTRPQMALLAEVAEEDESGWTPMSFEERVVWEKRRAVAWEALCEAACARSAQVKP